MFNRRSLRRARIDPLPNSPEHTDSDEQQKVENPLQQLSLSSLLPPLPPVPNPLPELAAAAAAADPAAVPAVVAAAADAAVAAPRRRRGKYHIMSDEVRGMALDLMLNQRQSVAQVGRTLGNGVSKATLYSLRRSFIKTNATQRKKKGGSVARYTEQDAEVLRAIQDEHHEWTYPQLRTEWWTRTGKTAMRLSDGTVNRMLKEGRFSSKQLIPVPAARNTPANIEARRLYSMTAASWLMNQIVYIDEAGFNLHLIRRRGRSRIGQRATIGTTWR